MFRRHPRSRPAGLGRALPALLVTALAALLPAGPALAVANGEPVPAGRYGFVARLALFGTPEQRLTNPSSVCSGALIAPQWIITAGHCFLDHGSPYGGRPTTSPTATVGRGDVAGKDGHQAEIVQVWQSPKADVALAQLDASITEIVPIRLATSPPSAGQVLRLAGWGMTGPRPAGLTTRLLTGQVRVGSVTDATLGVVGQAPSSTTCACPSDSGAPYFVDTPNADPVLVAVESDGPTCPHDQEETSYRVDVIADWISQTMAAASPSVPPRPQVAPRPGSLGPLGIGGLMVLVFCIAGGLMLLGWQRRPASADAPLPETEPAPEPASDPSSDPSAGPRHSAGG